MSYGILYQSAFGSSRNIESAVPDSKGYHNSHLSDFLVLRGVLFVPSPILPSPVPWRTRAIASIRTVTLVL